MWVWEETIHEHSKPRSMNVQLVPTTIAILLLSRSCSDCTCGSTHHFKEGRIKQDHCFTLFTTPACRVSLTNLTMPPTVDYVGHNPFLSFLFRNVAPQHSKKRASTKMAQFDANLVLLIMFITVIPTG